MSFETTNGLTILITGGCGFIGSDFLRYVLANDRTVRAINFDLLTYAENLGNCEDFAQN